MDKDAEPALKLKSGLKSVRFFTDREAWAYFRITAFGEAIGWTTLLSGIAIHTFLTPRSSIAVDIAGQIHGTIFLVYLVSVFVLAASLKWSRREFVLAVLASIPPYGTLVFERHQARKRHRTAVKDFRQIVVRAIIVGQDEQLLMLQPSDSGFWCLPGGIVGARESTQQALSRHLKTLTGATPKVGDLLYVMQYSHRQTERLEFFFSIQNPQAFTGLDYVQLANHSREIDELAFMSLRDGIEFEPAALAGEPLTQAGKSRNRTVKFIESSS